MENRYSVYQKIRQDRTYRTLGKMSWWRVALGISLLLLVLLISGTVSQFCASGGHFKLAEKLMIAPAWMEKYKPETRDYIEAGVLFQEGDYESAFNAFRKIENLKAAGSMESVSAVKLASERISAGEYDGAYDAIMAVDFSQLPENNVQEYRTLCAALCEYYRAAGGGEADTRADALLAAGEMPSGTQAG